MSNGSSSLPSNILGNEDLNNGDGKPTGYPDSLFQRESMTDKYLN